MGAQLSRAASSPPRPPAPTPPASASAPPPPPARTAPPDAAARPSPPAQTAPPDAAAAGGASPPPPAPAVPLDGRALEMLFNSYVSDPTPPPPSTTDGPQKRIYRSFGDPPPPHRQPTVPYQLFQTEALDCLKTENFGGFKWEIQETIDNKMALSHSIYLGSNVPPDRSVRYEFGAIYGEGQQVALAAQMINDGSLSARIIGDPFPGLTVLLNSQFVREGHVSSGNVRVGYTGSEYNLQGEYRTDALYTSSYVRSLTPKFSLGTEVFWLGHQKLYGISLAARLQNRRMVATSEVSSTGILSSSYYQRISDNHSFACDLTYNHGSGNMVARGGYDYDANMCHIKGMVDSTMCVTAVSESSVDWRIWLIKIKGTLLLSAMVDPLKKDYQLGIGLRLR